MRSKLRRTYTLARLALLLALAVTVVIVVAIQFQIHTANKWQQYVPLPQTRAPGAEDSVVVFAPHADDETLGCGGLLALAARNGAKVRVVLMTNGDGFRVAVATAYRTLRVTPARCIDFAYRRQKETLRALSILGVPAHCVTFLGYPDRGIARMWDTNWLESRPFFSKFTGLDHSPYHNSYTRSAPYSGESLIRDIQSILTETKPTLIYVPHPCDDHSDHYATYCFVAAAIEQLKAGGHRHAGSARVRTYLVHRGDWPVPKGDNPGSSLVPPHAMANGGTRWSALRLPDEVTARKRMAIRCYRTQTALEKNFLMSFARGNELFGEMPPNCIAECAVGCMKVDGSPEDWSGTPPAVIDPVGDFVVADINRGGDVRSIYARSDGKSLFVRVDCVRRLSKRTRYTLNFRVLGQAQDDGSQAAWYSVTVQPGKPAKPAGTRWAYKANVLELAVPLSKLQLSESLFIQVRTSVMKISVDNTGWHRVGIDLPKKAGAADQQ